MGETKKQDNVISMLSGFTGDITSAAWVQIPPPASKYLRSQELLVTTSYISYSARTDAVIRKLRDRSMCIFLPSMGQPCCCTLFSPSTPAPAPQ